MQRTEPALKAAIAKVADLQAKHGDWVLVGIKGTSLELLETGNGVETLRDALKDDQCNFVLLTLRLTTQQVPDQPRHIFMHWKGPKAKAMQKVKANEMEGLALQTLKPNHGQLEVVGKNNFDEFTISEKWAPEAGSHVID
eukprot:TRINITY_DN1507_c1_g2_i1.p1 TRINITY_DN1507_c1_g2~~TRINITY_DN1507_c1_g2_i1.p1  ORF type:complete len:150 (-),score=45.68 TRINITY_DN1507_c1_g2_i1:82-501(-)